MNLGQYRHSIELTYGTLEEQYVIQDAENVYPAARIQEQLFTDRILSTWNPKPGENDIREDQVAREVETYKIIDGLSQCAQQHVLLVGKPGSGKTTALHKLMLEEIQCAKQITILVELRRFETSILDIVYTFTKKHQLGLSLEAVQQQLVQGQCLLLIDGLNELPSEAAQEDLRTFLRKSKSCRIVATTRDIELGGDFGISKKLELQPLTAKQVEEFIRVHLVEEQATSMLHQLQPRLKEFQETPLLLLMLCEVFKKYERIPTNLGLAFRESAQLYDDVFKQGIKKISYCRSVLGHLAFRMQQGKDRLNPLVAISEEDAIRWISELTKTEDSYTWAKDWLTFLRQYHLLQKRSDLRIEFQHQLWQEYYAAEYLLECIPKLEDKQIKCNFLNLLKWTEPLKLMQLLTENQTQALRIAKLGLETDLLLGTSLSGAVRSEFAQKSIDQLMAYAFPIKRKYTDLNLWVLSRTKQILLLLLLKRISHCTAVNVSAFLKSSDSKVRCNTISALGDATDSTTIGILVAALKDRNADVRNNAAFGLGLIGDSSAIKPLVAALKDKSDFVRIQAVSALGSISEASTVEYIVTMLKDKDDIVRMYAAKALGKIGDISAIKPLVAALKDSNNFVRASAAEALGEIGDSSAIKPLVAALKDKDYYAGRSAGEALSRIGSGPATTALIMAINDSDNCVRRSATYAQGSMSNSSAVAVLLSKLTDRDRGVRRSAADALSKVGDSAATELLVFMLKDKDDFARSSAAKALGEIGDSAAIKPLIKLLATPNFVCRSAADALGQIGSSVAVKPLIPLLKRRDKDIRSSATKALGNLGDSSVAQFLEAGLEDEEYFIRRSTIDALGKIGTGDFISKIWRIQLQAKYLYEGPNYIEAIELIQNRCQFYNDVLYKEGEYKLTLIHSQAIPPVNPSQIQANFTGSIGSVNINSVVTGSSAGSQINIAPQKKTDT